MAHMHTLVAYVWRHHTHTVIGLGDELSGAGPLSQELC